MPNFTALRSLSFYTFLTEEERMKIFVFTNSELTEYYLPIVYFISVHISEFLYTSVSNGTLIYCIDEKDETRKIVFVQILIFRSHKERT